MLENFYLEAVRHGETKAADELKKLIDERENPELYRHSRKRLSPHG